MVDSFIQAELLAACSGLGYSDGDTYHLEADCLESVKDLIRYLRRDNDSHQIRRALGEAKVVETDLIPIIKFHASDKDLFDVTLRLLVNLSNPVILLFKEELPEEKVTRQHYLQMISHQQSFKEAFADENFWNILIGHLGEILGKSWEEREDEEKLVVERILLLVRNVLIVASSPEEEKRTDDDASVHDQVLWALHLARFEDLILYLASSEMEQDLCMHVIEIISLMLKEQDPTHLANAGLHRSQSEKEKDDKALFEIRKQEDYIKQQKLKKHYSARHSRFGGTYYILNVKSISDRDLISHKPVTDLKTLSFDHSKRSKKIPKNRLPMKDFDITRKSTLAIRLFLQEFCMEFLVGAFNSLMYIVKDWIDRAKVQEHDESYYMWSLKFFLEFNRNQNFRVELISEILSVQTFHYIQTLLESYFETMTTDKKKIPLWSRRMHRALQAYKELLMTLSFMDKSDKVEICESSKVLKSKVFYVIEYRELVLILLQNYNELKMSKSYLKDLIETAHICLKLLEGICKLQKHLLVQSKGKRMIKRKKHSKKSENLPLGEEELIMRWEEKSDDLIAIIKGEFGELPSSIPFDPVSDLSDEEQKEMAMKRIHSLLRNGDLRESVSLLRSSREIWPEGDIFGASDIEHLDELFCLRMIFMANISSVNPELISANEQEESEVEEDSDDQKAIESRMKEEELNFVGFVRRFSHVKVIQSYALLFKSFFNNSDNINHCILKMFHRLAWDCKIVAIFFQASIFRTFQLLFNHVPVISQTHKDALKFAKFVMREFSKVAVENPKVFVELLFWKNNKEALEIECGYELPQTTQSNKSHWSEEEEDELHRLYNEFKDNTEEGKDLLTRIMENLINQNRSSRIVIQKLKSMNLISNSKQLRKTIRSQAPEKWSVEEETELQNLVEENLDAVHPIQIILDQMSFKYSKTKVINKIIDMGLVKNRKDLQNKRVSKKRESRNTQVNILHENASEESDLEESESHFEDECDKSVQDESLEYSHKDSNSISLSQPPTPTLIKSCLLKAFDNGLREAVQWIAELLQETADERESDGNFDPVPLLSMTENCNTAMENDEFLQLLNLLGIQGPQNHQEMFWRIPSNISIESLRKRVQFLNQGINGEINEGILLESLSFPKKNKRKSSEKRNKKKSIPDEALLSSIEITTDNGEPSSLKHEGQSKLVKRSLRDMSDKLLGTSSTERKKRRIIVSDPDDDDDDLEDSNSLRLHLDTETIHDNSLGNNTACIYDSDETESTIRSIKRKTFLVSDDEKESISPKTSNKRKIIEDSDDDLL